MRLLDEPDTVFATHFDDWKGPPVDEPMSDDLAGFVREVRRCSQYTQVIVPQHFVANAL